MRLNLELLYIRGSPPPWPSPSPPPSTRILAPHQVLLDVASPASSPTGVAGRERGSPSSLPSLPSGTCLASPSSSLTGSEHPELRTSQSDYTEVTLSDTTVEVSCVGSPLYEAPELKRVSAQNNPDVSSAKALLTPLQAMALDIYSLGRMLLQMLTGYSSGHAVYRAVECSRELCEETQPDPESGRTRAGCCAVLGCLGPEPSTDGSGEPTGRRRTVRPGIRPALMSLLLPLPLCTLPRPSPSPPSLPPSPSPPPFRSPYPFPSRYPSTLTLARCRSANYRWRHARCSPPSRKPNRGCAQLPTYACSCPSS